MGVVGPLAEDRGHGSRTANLVCQGRRSVTRPPGRRFLGRLVRSQHVLRVERREQGRAVPVARGGEEGSDDLTLVGTARKLPRRGRCALDVEREFVEAHCEQIVQGESALLGGCQRL